MVLALETLAYRYISNHKSLVSAVRVSLSIRTCFPRGFCTTGKCSTVKGRSGFFFPEDPCAVTGEIQRDAVALTRTYAISIGRTVSPSDSSSNPLHSLG